jgi:transposase
MIAAIGNGAAFRKGRGFAAWLGVVPGEHSTGGKQTLTGTQQAREQILEETLCAGSARRPATENEASCRS